MEAIRRLASDTRVLRLLPALAALLVYLANLDDFYVSDDFDHPYLGGYGWDQLSAHLFEPSGPGDFFRPLTRISMGLDHVEIRDLEQLQPMRARLVEDEAERARLWALAVEAYPPYEEYQGRTERVIPVFRAEPSG